MLFSKPEYETVYLPFIYAESEDDLNAGCISIEAYGSIANSYKYCYASYCLKDMKLYDNGGYEQMIESIKNASQERVEVIVKFKKGVAKDFKISIKSLAQVCKDQRLLQLELAGWGFNDKSYADMEWEYKLKHNRRD